MNTIKTQSLYGELEARYDTGFSQDISDHVNQLHRREIMFFDIKELNDMAAEYRERIRTLVPIYRGLKKQSQRHQSIPRQTYASYEGIFIRRQISDLWKLYRTAQTDSHDMTTAYKEQLVKSGSQKMAG